MVKVVTKQKATVFATESEARTWIKDNYDPSEKYEISRNDDLITHCVEVFHKGSGWSRGYIQVEPIKMFESVEKEQLTAQDFISCVDMTSTTLFLNPAELDIVSSSGMACVEMHVEVLDRDGEKYNRIVLDFK